MIRTSIDTPRGEDRYLLLSAGELTEQARKHAPTLRRNISRGWCGVDYDTFARQIETGDQDMVHESEEFLRQIEDQVPVSRGWRNVDDVVGAVPNVPAFLAGHPQCMRRRTRTTRETAPLSIYMDLTSSGGIDTRDVQKRGVVLLALTRMLVEHRAVELWVGASLGSTYRGGAGTVAWRIDTAPLDLARAAFHVAATSMSRGFGYVLCKDDLGTGGHWPFADYTYHRDTAPERLAQVFPGQQILYVPPVYLTDPMTTDPVGWLKRVMAQYVRSEE